MSMTSNPRTSALACMLFLAVLLLIPAMAPAPGLCVEFKSFTNQDSSSRDAMLTAAFDKGVRRIPYGSGYGKSMGLNLGMGPLNIRTQSPGQSLRLSTLHILPETFRAGNAAFFAGVTWTNIWAKEDRYLLDFEMLDTHLALSYCITNNFNLAAAITHRNYFGGAMDGFIQGFHDLFGFSQNGRDDVPKNDFNVVLYDEEGNEERRYDKKTADLNHTAFMLSGQWVLYEGDSFWPAVGLTGTVNFGLDTPPNDDPNEPVDYGLGAGMSKQWVTNWHTYHYAGITRYGKTRLFDVEFEKEAWYFMNALARHYGMQGSVVLQYMYHEGVVKTFGDLSEASHELNLGFKYRLGGGGVLQIAFIENIIEFNNSPDFGVNLAYSYAW